MALELSTCHPRPLTARLLGLLAIAALGMAATWPSIARADCKDDIDKIMSRRLGAVAALNALSKTSGGKLDPVAACPRLRNLASIEADANAYFSKNKDWCNLPDDFVGKMAAAHAKSVSFAEKACSFAAMAKQQAQRQAQQQQQQQQEMAPKLPTGPL